MDSLKDDLAMVARMPRSRANSTDNITTGSSNCSSSPFTELMLHHRPLHALPISEDDNEMSDGYSRHHSENDEETSSNSSSGSPTRLLEPSVSVGSFNSSPYSLPNFFQSDHRKAIHEELSERTCPFGASLEPSASCNSRNNKNRYFSTLVFTARRRKHPFLFATISAFTFMGLFLYTKSYATLHSALEQVTILTQERRQVHKHFKTVEEDIQRLQRQLLELDQAAGGWSVSNGGSIRNEASSSSSTPSATITTSTVSEGDGSTSQGAEHNADAGNRSVNRNNNNGDQAKENALVGEMVALQEKLREGSSQIGNLHKHIQAISKRDALFKYGSGVIRVQIELEFPNDTSSAINNNKDQIGGFTTIILEMAPLDLMPHSVYMFLEMVHAGLFDGCSFILNAMHVIKAAPLPYDGSSASQKVKAFTKRGLESVAFREFSPDYPHDQYTVGFAADGSPSFYINTQDNSEIHVGEPCFAKVVSGFDAVGRLEAAPTRNGIWYRRRIGLKKAVIL